MRAIAITAMGLCLVPLLGDVSVQGATLRVPEDYPSVLAAVDAAVSGDSVVVGPGTWTDTATRIVPIGGWPTTFTCCAFLKGGVTLVSRDGAAVTSLDAGVVGAGSVGPLLFANALGEEVVVEGFTLTGTGSNYSVGVLGIDAGGMVIRRCRVVHNTNLGEGKPVSMRECDLVMEDSEVSFNEARVWGGIRVWDSSVELRRCRFEGNVGRCFETRSMIPPPVTTIIEDCEFIGNRSQPINLSDQSWVEVTGCVFLGNSATVGGGAILAESTGLVSGNLFAYDSTGVAGSGGALLLASFSGEVSENTFFGCHAPGSQHGGGSAVWVSGVAPVFRNNIFASCTGSAVFRIDHDVPSFSADCNAFWDNEAGIGPYVPGPHDVFGDPQFCDPMTFDFTLRDTSPCAPKNNPDCGGIGAYGVGCGTVGLNATSWGRIKALHR